MREFPLNINLQTRFGHFLADYIFNRVAMAIYFKTFDGCRKPLIKDLMLMSQRSFPMISFLVDYAAVLIRQLQWKKQWSY